MRIRRLLVIALTTTALAVPALPADAAVIAPVPGPVAAGNGIALGADGNLWVAEENNNSVVRMTPAGVVVGRYGLGGRPTTVTTGPGGKVWVAVTGADKLAVFDTTAATPTPTYIPTPSPCGPVAIVAGGNGRMYFSMPSDGAPGCTDMPQLGSVSDTGGTVTASNADIGVVFDLAVSGGKLFAPDFEGEVVRRLTLAAAPVVDATLTALGQPDGITVDTSGALWLTAFSTGNLLRFAPTGTAATVITPTGGTLISPFGIESGPGGAIFVTGSDSQNLLRINKDGTGSTFFPTPAGSRPLQITNGPDGDLFVTDSDVARILRFVDGAPRAVTGTAKALTAATGSLSASVDPRGNDTQVVFDYGTTTSYGLTTAPTTVAAAAAQTAVTGSLAGLKPQTTYHVRARATSALGVTAGADTTFTTPKARGKAKLGTAKAAGGATRVKTLKITDMIKGDKIALRCKGDGCKAKASVKVKVKKSGALKLTSAVKGLVLAPGARLIVTIKRADGIRTTTVFTMVKGKKPKVTQK